MAVLGLQGNLVEDEDEAGLGLVIGGDAIVMIPRSCLL